MLFNIWYSSYDMSSRSGGYRAESLGEMTMKKGRFYYEWEYFAPLRARRIVPVLTPKLRSRMFDDMINDNSQLYGSTYHGFVLLGSRTKKKIVIISSLFEVNDRRAKLDPRILVISRLDTYLLVWYRVN